MLRVGLTGSIGSGKSTVSSAFSHLGIPVIDMDVIARDVVAPGQPGLNLVAEQLGDNYLRSDGTLDRQALRVAIFEQPALRTKLESLLHPLIRQATEKQIAQLNAPYCIIVIPLLFESGQQDLVDFIVVVDADEDVCIQRIVERDAIDAGLARKMLGAQTDRKLRLNGANAVIDNNGSREEIMVQIEHLHRQLLSLAESGT